MIRLIENEVIQRGSKFNEFLSPLIKNPRLGGPAYDRKTLQRSQLVFFAFDARLTTDHRECRFATFHKDFRANYFEIWMQKERQNYWYLKQTYLNIYLIDRIKHAEIEYICLHSDPLESNDSKAKYKQSPHLHILKAESPIPKAHIALAGGFLKKILSSEKDLFDAMKIGVELIKEEILERID